MKRFNAMFGGPVPAMLLKLLPPGVAVLFLLSISANEISSLQVGLAYCLSLVPWLSYLNWRKRGREGLPIFSMISFMYALYYVMPLFAGDWTVDLGSAIAGRSVSSEKVTEALVMTLTGVGFLWLGLKAGIGKAFVSRRLPELHPGKLTKSYLRALLLGGMLLGFSGSGAGFLGGDTNQIGLILTTVLPTVGFVLLFRGFLRGEIGTIDKVLIVLFLAARLFGGLASGWLGSSAALLVICAATYILERRRVPRSAVIAVMLFTLFFQVSKDEFRGRYWRENTAATQTDRVSFWATASMDRWEEAFTDKSGSAFRETLNQSLSRTSLLPQTADVLEQTPSVVPYQYGRLYSYLLITWIPRFVWPDKPSVNEANQFYQVAYGLTTEDNLDQVSIAVGVLPESFINFGWLGVPLIMFLLGVFFDFYQRTCFEHTSGPLMQAIGIVVLPQFLSIESQMAVYLSGLIQQVILIMILLIPVIRLKARGAGLRVQTVLP